MLIWHGWVEFLRELQKGYNNGFTEMAKARRMGKVIGTVDPKRVLVLLDQNKMMIL